MSDSSLFLRTCRRCRRGNAVTDGLYLACFKYSGVIFAQPVSQTCLPEQDLMTVTIETPALGTGTADKGVHF